MSDEIVTTDDLTLANNRAQKYLLDLILTTTANSASLSKDLALAVQALKAKG